MKSTGGGLRGWEKAKWGSLWDWIKRQDRETHTSFTLVRTGELMMNVSGTQRWCAEGFCDLPLWCWRLCVRGLEKGIDSSDFSKVCYRKFKRKTGSLQANIDVVKEATSCHDLLLVRNLYVHTIACGTFSLRVDKAHHAGLP